MPDVTTNYDSRAELAACAKIMREMGDALKTAQLALRHVRQFVEGYVMGNPRLVVDLALRDVDRALAKYRGEE